MISLAPMLPNSWFPLHFLLYFPHISSSRWSLGTWQSFTLHGWSTPPLTCLGWSPMTRTSALLRTGPILFWSFCSSLGPKLTPLKLSLALKLFCKLWIQQTSVSAGNGRGFPQLPPHLPLRLRHQWVGFQVKRHHPVHQRDGQARVCLRPSHRLAIGRCC